MTWYCAVAKDHPVHAPYHDHEYGFPVIDEKVLFERLALEIFQAGLSWEITLKKRAETAKAFHRFNVNKVAAYQDADIQRLLDNSGIIRNRLKINAIIHNANVIKSLRKSHGGFADFLVQHHPLQKKEWVRLFSKTFKFTGGEIVGEFLMSIGYLPDAHDPACSVYRQLNKNFMLPWYEAQKKGFKF